MRIIMFIWNSGPENYITRINLCVCVCGGGELFLGKMPSELHNQPLLSKRLPTEEIVQELFY